MSLAGIEAVMLGLPGLTPGALSKLAEIADLEKAGTAWEDQPRVSSGQADGGQWTADGGGAATPSSGDEQASAPAPSGGGLRTETGDAADEADRAAPADNPLLVPVSTAAVAAHGAPGSVALPRGVSAAGGLVALAAAFLDQWGERNAQEKVTNVLARFGLDPSRRADVIAASAFVWSGYQLGMLTDAPFNGPALDAASQAVMRFALVNPDIFLAWNRDPKVLDLIKAAANAGLADYAAESRARPTGVDPSLQTTSEKARAAIVSQLITREMQAHHLIPAAAWGKNLDLARLAYQAGWRVDAPSNLIALPSDPATQAMFGGLLPIHNSRHGNYSQIVEYKIDIARGTFASPITPLEARAIFDNIALQERASILLGVYNPIMKGAEAGDSVPYVTQCGSERDRAPVTFSHLQP
ncbi:MAG TPA: AHH domain-containing protein [Caulobacteraceae bacterium]